MVIMTLFEELKTRSQALTSIESVVGLLSWDQETLMPVKGTGFRARQRATIASLYHEQLVSDRMASLLEQLSSMELDEVQSCTVRELKRLHSKEVRKPVDLVMELARVSAEAYEQWVRARENSDFAAFAPWLQKMLDLKKEEARCLAPDGDPYETLLDEFEPGVSRAELDHYFSFLRPRLTDLTLRIQDSEASRGLRGFKGSFPRGAQEKFSRQIVDAMGFDWEAGRVDTSPHPFCSGLSPYDVRITTRYDEEDFTGSLFGIVHEAGHALYELGLNAEYYGLPVCEAISLGIHESQSRLWENQIARSRPFWTHWFPKLKTAFPGQLDHLSEREFLLKVNRVSPSLIRVEADEVTYGLHVILRYEIETGLLAGTIAVNDLPELWNEKMREYLGVAPPDDAQGVLQDTHWSQGLVGYFPTYLLGNLYSSQWMRQIHQNIPDLDQQVASGRMLELREWLRVNIHRPGKLFSASGLVEHVTGEALSADYFIEYLETKYGELYNL